MLPPTHFHWIYGWCQKEFSAELQRPSFPTGLTFSLPSCRATRRVKNGTHGSYWLRWASWPSRSSGYSWGEGTTRTCWILRLLSVCWHSLQWSRIHRYTQCCLGAAWYCTTLDKTKCMQTNYICNSALLLSLIMYWGMDVSVLKYLFLNSKQAYFYKKLVMLCSPSLLLLCLSRF